MRIPLSRFMSVIFLVTLGASLVEAETDAAFREPNSKIKSGPVELTIHPNFEQSISDWLEHNRVYPEAAKKRGLEGEARVSLTLNREGQLLKSRLLQSTGHEMLDRAALEMVQRANPFPAVPRTYVGKTFRFDVPVQFRLLER